MRSGLVVSAVISGTMGCGDSGGGPPGSSGPDAGPVAPEIVRFEASNAVVDEAETIFLGWETLRTETVSVRAEPGDPLLEASLRVNSVVESEPLVVPTRFVLTASGPGGEVEASVDVDVRPPDEDEPPRIIEFFVSPSTYQGREVDARLSWTATGELQLSRNGAPVPEFDGEPFGALVETISEPRVEYELTATRAGMTVSATRAIARSDFEVEPNDRPGNASVPSGDEASGRIDEGDRDSWVVEVPELGRVTAFVDDGAEAARSTVAWSSSATSPKLPVPSS